MFFLHCSIDGRLNITKHPLIGGNNLGYLDLGISIPFDNIDDTVSVILKHFRDGAQMKIPFQTTITFQNKEQEIELVDTMVKVLTNAREDFLILNSFQISNIGTNMHNLVRNLAPYKSYHAMQDIWRMWRKPYSFMMLRRPQTIYDALYISSYAASYPLYLLITLVDENVPSEGFIMIPNTEG